MGGGYKEKGVHFMCSLISDRYPGIYILNLNITDVNRRGKNNFVNKKWRINKWGIKHKIEYNDVMVYYLFIVNYEEETVNLCFAYKYLKKFKRRKIWF